MRHDISGEGWEGRGDGVVGWWWGRRIDSGLGRGLGRGLDVGRHK